MPTLQSLRKKLRGIRTTQKISKAMKTASTIKFSKLNSAFGEYSKYCEKYEKLYKKYEKSYSNYFNHAQSDAPVCYIILTSNKGMCGSFNSELLSFAKERLSALDEKPVVFVCGKKARDFFEKKGLPFEKSFIFGDVPSFSEASELFEEISSRFGTGKISSVKIIYPKYANMMMQTPTEYELLKKADADKKDEKILAYPDKETFIAATSERIMEAFIFKKILECALGAQASTLLTMRSAYDNATEYSAQLESDINRKRQSQVTSDVIETSSERSQKEI